MNSNVLFSREIYVPPEILYEVWTHPDHLAQWYNPPDDDGNAPTEVSVSDDDTRIELVWRDRDGAHRVVRRTYETITPPSHLVYTLEYEGAGNVHSSRVSVRFVELGGSTRMDIEQSEFSSSVAQEEYHERWPQLIERLMTYLSAI